MSRKKIYLGLGVIVIAALIALIAFSGSFIKPLLEMGVRQAGFPDANIESVYVTPNGILLENIYLDADAFSTIDSAQITGSWTDIIFKHTITSVELRNVNLSGEIDEQGRYIIAGWNASLSDNSTSSPPAVLIENLALNGLTLDFETPEGAIRIEGKLALQSATDKTRTFQANLWGKQKQLALNATATGKIGADGQWNADIELLEGRIDMESVKATRAAGTVSLKSVPAGIIYQGKMAAGGVRIKDIPFQDFEVTFDASKPEILEFSTSPTGHDGVTITGQLLNRQPLTLTIGVNVKDIDDLASLFELKKTDLAWIRKSDPLTLNVSAALADLSAPQIPLTWTLAAGPSAQKVAGSATYNRSGQRLSGIITSSTLAAQTLSELLPLKEIGQIELTEGSLTLSGDFVSDLSQEKLRLDGHITLSAKKIGGIWQDYPFNGGEGIIKMAGLYPWTFEKDQKLALAAIGTGINLTDGVVIFDGSEAKGLAVHQANFNMAGGTLATAPFIWRSNAKENLVTVRLENISLTELSNTIAADGFTATGSLNGSLPMAFTKDGISFRSGTLSSPSGGRFSYAPSSFPAALQGDDARMTTVRQALSDFQYSSLEVTVNGDLNDNLGTTLKASGKNPVFSDRVINLNINLEGALIPALEQALQPGKIADRIEKSVTGDQ